MTWLGASTALPTLAAVDVWRNTGYWAIFFVAALIGLPQELYQAASLDGAGAFARFRFLTLPLLRRIILFAIVVATIWGLQVFDTALIMTAGGPGTATTTIVYRIWQYVFAYDDKIGLAAAMSALLVDRSPGADPDPAPRAARPAGDRLAWRRSSRSIAAATDRGARRRQSPQGARAGAATPSPRIARPSWRARARDLDLRRPLLLRRPVVTEAQRPDLLLPAEAPSSPGLLRKLQGAAAADSIPAVDAEHPDRRGLGQPHQGLPGLDGGLRPRQAPDHGQAAHLPADADPAHGAPQRTHRSALVAGQQARPARHILGADPAGARQPAGRVPDAAVHPRSALRPDGRRPARWVERVRDLPTHRPAADQTRPRRPGRDHLHRSVHGLHLATDRDDEQQHGTADRRRRGACTRAVESTSACGRRRRSCRWCRSRSCSSRCSGSSCPGPSQERSSNERSREGN